ncbi:MAG: hypothetical protein WC634_05015 [archaeon]
MDLNKARESLVLDKGEEFVANLSCRADWVETGPPEAFESKNGALVLTSNRLVFLKTGGFWSNELSPLFSLALKSVVNITTGGALMKHMVVSVERGEKMQDFTFYGKEKELQSFRGNILEQRAEIKEKEVVTAQKIIIEEKPEEKPMEVLKRKLAKGEITTEEFHKRVQRM